MPGRVVTGLCLAVHALYHLQTASNEIPFRARTARGKPSRWEREVLQRKLGWLFLTIK